MFSVYLADFASYSFEQDWEAVTTELRASYLMKETVMGRLSMSFNILMADMELNSVFGVPAFTKSDGFELNVALNEERSFKEGACGSSLIASTLQSSGCDFRNTFVSYSDMVFLYQVKHNFYCYQFYQEEILCKMEEM